MEMPQPVLIPGPSPWGLDSLQGWEPDLTYPRPWGKEERPYVLHRQLCSGGHGCGAT